MRSKTFLFISIVILAIGAIVWIFSGGRPSRFEPAVTAFDECVTRGFPVMESYPRQCKDDEGNSFTEDIGNTLEKTDLIRVTTPSPNIIVKSPLSISGEARGYWFFEASFPIKVLDGNGTVLGIGIAQATTEWMTEDFVPFSTTIVFNVPGTRRGTLVLQKDNPSGLPKHDDELRFPIVFE